MRGFTSSVGVSELAGLGPPVVVDIGSGLLVPDPLLPAEPDATTALSAGAALVTASGDKLLGGPQAGLLLGSHRVVERLRRHPLARAVRVDKLTLAALEATVAGPATPTWQALRRTAAELRSRAEGLRAELSRHSISSDAVETASVIGGGGAPGVELVSWAIAVDPSLAAPLRAGEPSVIGRLDQHQLLLDLRCIPPDLDVAVRAAIVAAAESRGV
jgi:L-seryl-tRNA(Ser) seleniumtransferase